MGVNDILNIKYFGGILRKKSMDNKLFEADEEEQEIDSDVEDLFLDAMDEI